jgi:hypothetical protein
MKGATALAEAMLEEAIATVQENAPHLAPDHKMQLTSAVLNAIALNYHAHATAVGG